MHGFVRQTQVCTAKVTALHSTCPVSCSRARVRLQDELSDYVKAGCGTKLHWPTWQWHGSLVYSTSSYPGTDGSRIVRWPTMFAFLACSPADSCLWIRLLPTTQPPPRQPFQRIPLRPLRPGPSEDPPRPLKRAARPKNQRCLWFYC